MILIFIVVIFTSCEKNFSANEQITTNDMLETKKNSETGMISENTTEEPKIENDANISISYKFVLVDINKVSREKWAEYTHGYETKVLLKDNNTLLTILTVPDVYNSRIKIFDMQDGYLVGYDFGEFRGHGLYYKPQYGDFYSLGNHGTTAGFYTFDERWNEKTVYILDGYPQFSSKGYVLKAIRNENDIWEIDEDFKIDLGEYFTGGGYPQAFLVEDETVYIVTQQQLIKVIGEKIEQILIEKAFWYGLYPNSIVRIDNLLWIGMRGGIASYDLDTGELLWYEQVLE